MGRRATILLALLWGFLVLFAIFGGIVGVVLAGKGEAVQAVLVVAASCGLMAVAYAIERVVELKRYGTRVAARRLTFRRVSARAARVGLAALIVGLVGISAKQVSVIADVGVADWLRTDTTSPFEVGVVIVALHLLLFLVAWPLWTAGEYVWARIYAIRLSRSIKRPL